VIIELRHPHQARTAEHSSRGYLRDATGYIVIQEVIQEDFTLRIELPEYELRE
jgi:hypothetical protein